MYYTLMKSVSCCFFAFIALACCSGCSAAYRSKDSLLPLCFSFQPVDLVPVSSLAEVESYVCNFCSTNKDPVTEGAAFYDLQSKTQGWCRGMVMPAFLPIGVPGFERELPTLYYYNDTEEALLLHHVPLGLKAIELCGLFDLGALCRNDQVEYGSITLVCADVESVRAQIRSISEKLPALKFLYLYLDVKTWNGRSFDEPYGYEDDPDEPYGDEDDPDEPYACDESCLDVSCLIGMDKMEFLVIECWGGRVTGYEHMRGRDNSNLSFLSVNHDIVINNTEKASTVREHKIDNVNEG